MNSVCYCIEDFYDGNKILFHKGKYYTVKFENSLYVFDSAWVIYNKHAFDPDCGRRFNTNKNELSSLSLYSRYFENPRKMKLRKLNESITKNF